MDKNNEELIERLREKCRQQRWHGPDIHNPFPIVEQMRQQRAREQERYASLPPGVRFTWSARYWHDRNRKCYEISLDTDLSQFPLQTDFEYAPATEEELAAAEATLGCALPSLVREVYSKLANGGFGPGYGLQGVRGGFTDDPPPAFDIDRESALDLGIDIAPDAHQNLKYIPLTSGLFTLCHWGCAIYSVLDCSSGRVFRAEGVDTASITAIDATSLYEWLDLWAKGVDLWCKMYPNAGSQ